jgi:hypothetical protein
VTDAWSAAEPVELRWHLGPGLRPELPVPHGRNFASPVRSVLSALRAKSLQKLEFFGFDFSPFYGQRLPCLGVRAVLAPATRGCLVSRFKVRANDQINHQNVTG